MYEEWTWQSWCVAVRVAEALAEPCLACTKFCQQLTTLIITCQQQPPNKSLWTNRTVVEWETEAKPHSWPLPFNRFHPHSPPVRHSKRNHLSVTQREERLRETAELWVFWQHKSRDGEMGANSDEGQERGFFEHFFYVPERIFRTFHIAVDF